MGSNRTSLRIARGKVSSNSSSAGQLPTRFNQWTEAGLGQILCSLALRHFGGITPILGQPSRRGKLFLPFKSAQLLFFLVITESQEITRSWSLLCCLVEGANSEGKYLPEFVDLLVRKGVGMVVNQTENRR